MEAIQAFQLHFPSLNDKALKESIFSTAQVKQYKEGDTIIRKGQYIKVLPLLLEGSIRVSREDEEGNEVMLYYLGVGESCAMSINCGMEKEESGITAIAEQDTTVLMIPHEQSMNWMGKHARWRAFIINTYSLRFSEMIQTIDAIAFHKLDDRLWKYLNDKAEVLQTKMINTTHSEIARSLFSSREAISRLLKKLEEIGKVELKRNQIIIKE